MVDRVGLQFGKYRLGYLLGQGGFGEVWKALDTQLERYVAIKLLHANLQADPEFVKRFEHEALAIASLHHPNIVPLHDFGIRSLESNTPIAYMVMAYIGGQTLADYIANTSARGRIPSPVEIVNLFTPIGLAVDYAHQKGMVHHDIKPLNILLDVYNTARNPMGEPILTDFGLAKLLGVSAGAARATQLDTVLYTSPEQAQGQPGDERSDMYSLGVILYEMVTGVTPFRGNNPIALMMQHLNEMPTPPTFINPTISPALSEVILKSIAKDPDARFQSASAFTSALANAFNDPTSTELRPPEVFFSYAHQDKGLRDRLENHLSNLKYRGLITTWYDREIQAGGEWARQIDIHLDKAHIILLLISADFMASQYCYDIEMKRALERHKSREADVIPILLRPVLYADAPFAKLQMLPTNGKPVVNWRNRDSAFVDIALGIERVVQKRLERLTPALPMGPQVSDLPIYTGPQVTNLFQSPQGSSPTSLLTPPLPPPPTTLSRRRRGGFILVGLGFLGLLSASVFLLVPHPSFIPFVGVIVVSFMLLAGILLVIRALIKKAHSRAARRHERERAQRRQLEEAQRREQEEIRRQELEELRRRERERTYYEKALAAYEQALRQNNKDATAYRGKGNALVRLGHYNEALTAFEQAVALMPLPTTYVSMGNVLTTLGRRDEAMTAYQQALALDSSYASAYAGMSEALLQLGRTQEAGEMRERAERLGYED